MASLEQHVDKKAELLILLIINLSMQLKGLCIARLHKVASFAVFYLTAEIYPNIYLKYNFPLKIVLLCIDHSRMCIDDLTIHCILLIIILMQI